jgi:hypothetical protein
MRIQTRPATSRPPARKPVPFTFQCTGCEAVEHRPHPTLPLGWVTVEICADLQAFCAECAPAPQEPLQ